MTSEPIDTTNVAANGDGAQEHSTTPRTVTILGSCVSRDTLETMSRDAWPLGGYYARTSLLSAGSNAANCLPSDFESASPFQQRNVRADIDGRLVPRLMHWASSDVLVWDLVDERHGVFEFSDGAIVTRSIDVLAISQFKPAIASARHIAFGSDEHYARWCGAATMLRSSLDALKLVNRTLVLAPDWAEFDTTGAVTPASMGVHATEANERFRRYHDFLGRLGFPVARFANTEADPEHKWGLAPFHYSDRVYAQMRAAICDFATSGT